MTAGGGTARIERSQTDYTLTAHRQPCSKTPSRQINCSNSLAILNGKLYDKLLHIDRDWRRWSDGSSKVGRAEGKGRGMGWQEIETVTGWTGEGRG